MRLAKRLTNRTVATTTKPGRYGDGDGLWLQVTPQGTKSWLLRYMHRGRARHMGLGPVSLVSLAEARDRARTARRRLLDGIDPLEQRQLERDAAKIASARALTFKQCGERYIEAHEAGWRNHKHAAQWRATLETYAYPIFGDLPVAAIDTGLAMQVLEPIWTTKPETASRVRGRIEAVLDWATARAYRRGDNPARWRGHLDKLLPKKTKVHKVRHQPALPYREMPGFMLQLREQHGTAARALEFTILTAARSGEVIRARWSEIDLEGAFWTIPANRMKSGRPHRVPLSDAAQALLIALPREGDHVFPGAQDGKPLSQAAMLMTLRRMGRADLTVHGFRSSFRDWAAEQTSYPSELAEMALAHVVSDKVEAAYRRGDMFEKRVRLMGDWSRYCIALRHGVRS